MDFIVPITKGGALAVAFIDTSWDKHHEALLDHDETSAGSLRSTN